MPEMDYGEKNSMWPGGGGKDSGKLLDQSKL